MLPPSTLAVDVQQLQARRVQPLHQDRQKALHHLIAEIMIGLAFFAQTCGIHSDRPRQPRGPGVRHPAVRRYQPGCADDFSLPERRNHDRRSSGRGDLQCHLAMADEKELVRGAALAKQVLAGIVAVITRTARHEPAVRRAESCKKGMLPQDMLKTLHAALPCPRSGLSEWRPPR